MTSETGYLAIENTSVVSQPGYVPYDVAEIYLPRVFLEQWNKGVERTLIYQFCEWPQGNLPHGSYGLVAVPDAANLTNLQPKPAYYAMQQLIALLEDPGDQTFPTYSLELSILGNATAIRTTLLQNRLGTFFLALWIELPAWNVNGKAYYPPIPSQAIEVVIFNPPVTFSPLAQMLIINGSGSLQTVNTSLQITSSNITATIVVSDRMSFLQLNMSSSPTTPPPPITSGSGSAGGASLWQGLQLARGFL